MKEEEQEMRRKENIGVWKQRQGKELKEANGAENLGTMHVKKWPLLWHGRYE